MEFEKTPTAFADAMAELVSWSGEYVHVEVSVADGAGICGFDARFEALAGGEGEGSVLLWFADEVGLVVLSDAMSAFTELDFSTGIRWLRFEIGEHQSIEVERVMPEEICRRVTGVVPNG